jgi:RNA polymerase-binding transcription factor DksA
MPRKWTPEQKKAQAQAMKDYWEKHPHPRRGQTATPETLELQRISQDRVRWEIRGYCKRCGDPIYSERTAELRYGPNCLKRAVAEGLVTYDPYTHTVTEVKGAS